MVNCEKGKFSLLSLSSALFIFLKLSPKKKHKRMFLQRQNEHVSGNAVFLTKRSSSKSWLGCVCVAHSSHPIYLVALCIMHEGKGTDGSSRLQCWHLIAYIFQMKRVEGKCQIFLRGNSEQNTDMAAKTNTAIFNSLIRFFLFFFFSSFLNYTVCFPFHVIVFVLPTFLHCSCIHTVWAFKHQKCNK